MPDDTLYQGTATDYLATHPIPAPDVPAEGGLFGETLGAKVARGLLYVVPIAGQIVAHKEQQKAAQSAQVNQLILSGALKAQDPELLQSPEIQKAAKGMFGPHGQTFLGVATHIAQHQKDVHNGWIGLMLKHGYGQPGRNPVDVMRDAAAEATHNGISIPQEAQSLISQHVLAPEIAKAKAEAVEPIKVRTSGEQQQIRESVHNAPENVGARAAGRAYETTEVEKAKDPFIARRLAERIAAHEKSQEAIDDRHNKERDLLFEKHRLEAFGDKRVPQKQLDDTVAFTQDGQQIQLPLGTTFDQIDQIRAQGGTVHSRTWRERLLPENPSQRLKPPTPKQVQTQHLTPAQEADQYFGGGQ